MNQDEKEPFPVRRIALAALVAFLVILVVAAFALAFGLPEPGKDSGCSEAAEWHYQEALKADADAEYHFWAGAAAEKLGEIGSSCQDWRAT